MPTSRTRPKPPRRKTPKRPAARMLPESRVAAAVRTMSEPTGTARFAAGKALCVTAEKDPGRVYAHFDAIAALLDSDCKIVRWNALQTLARLAPADVDRKLDGVLDAYLAPIRGDNLISAANAIQGAGRIGAARSDLLERVLPAILSVENARYETAECRNVALGHVLSVLAELGPEVCRRPEVANLIRRQQTNTRAAVARKARGILTDLATGAS